MIPFLGAIQDLRERQGEDRKFVRIVRAGEQAECSWLVILLMGMEIFIFFGRDWKKRPPIAG